MDVSISTISQFPANFVVIIIGKFDLTCQIKQVFFTLNSNEFTQSYIHQFTFGCNTCEHGGLGDQFFI